MFLEPVDLNLSTAIIALACLGAALAFAHLKHKFTIREATEALNYLNIHTVTDDEACDHVIQQIRRQIEKHKSVGFDCEWVSNNGKRRPVALIQLSTYDGLCGLFRLNILKSVPQSLKDLLEDKDIYKVGVAAYDDAQYLCQDYGVALKSTLDIRHMANVTGYKPSGLAAMSKVLLKITLDKSWRIRCSDWEAVRLSERQVQYAAADAHVAIRMFVKMYDECIVGPLVWVPQATNAEAWRNVSSVCKTFLDCKYKTKDYRPDPSLKKWANINNKKKTNKDKYLRATRSKPLYHNCFLEAPDGEMLCTCDNKKALWYVEKELADIVKDEPLTVRLRFEPAGRSVGDVGRYYQLTKENKCVVCGSSNSYIRKNVVPREYRKYFPEIMKDHSSHDVVLLCTQCHQNSNIRDQPVRDQLAADCGAPIATSCGRNDKYYEDSDFKKVRSAAHALLYHAQKHELPEDRQQELKTIILQHYTDHETVTLELLEEAAKTQFVFENTDYESHGLKVCESYLKRQGGLLALEELWRQHFLTSMQPQFMPDLWSVKHNEERLRVKYKEGRLSEENIELIGPSTWL